MKAAYANGVLTAFERAGHRPWDVVMGASAGGALGAWYSARQAQYAESTWAYARDPRILSYRRTLRGGPILDHEALLDIVYVEERPIDQQAIHDCPWPVVVTVADVDTGACVYQDIRGQDVIAWLKATGRLPFGAGPAVEIEGRTYIDGGAVDPIPVRHAAEVMGADQITLVLNKPPGPQRRDPRVIMGLAARRYPALQDGIMRHNEIKAASIAYAQNPPDGVQVDIVHPSRPTRLHRLSRDLEAIQDALRLGHADGATYIGAIP